MLAAGGALLLYVMAFFKELRVIMFSRADAAAAGIRVNAGLDRFLVLVAVVLTVNFQTVGGLMIYSLISNPAAAAFQLVRGCRRAWRWRRRLERPLAWAVFSFRQRGLPSGAVIVLVYPSCWRWRPSSGGLV